MLHVKVGGLRKQDPERTFGAHSGVLGELVKAAAFGLYQHREIRKGMHARSATMLIAVLISEEGNWGA